MKSLKRISSIIINDWGLMISAEVQNIVWESRFHGCQVWRLPGAGYKESDCFARSIESIQWHLYAPSEAFDMKTMELAHSRRPNHAFRYKSHCVPTPPHHQRLSRCCPELRQAKLWCGHHRRHYSLRCCICRGFLPRYINSRHVTGDKWTCLRCRSRQDIDLVNPQRSHETQYSADSARPCWCC